MADKGGTPTVLLTFPSQETLVRKPSPPPKQKSRSSSPRTPLSARSGSHKHTLQRSTSARRCSSPSLGHEATGHTRRKSPEPRRVKLRQRNESEKLTTSVSSLSLKASDTSTSLHGTKSESQLTRKSEDAQLREVEQIYASAVYALAEADRLLDKAKRYQKRLEMIEAEKKPIVELVNKAKEFLGITDYDDEIPDTDEILELIEELNEHRQMVAAEILATEKTLYTSLTSCVDVYKTTLAPIIKPVELNLIFGNFDAVIKVSSQLAEALEAVVADWSPTQAISPVFLNPDIDLLLPFSDFTNHFDEARDALLKISNSKAAAAALKEAHADSRVKRLSIPDFLIMPVQRPPRYVLLLTELLRNTLPEHPDFEGLFKALTRVKDVADEVNMRKKNYESKQNMMKAVSSIEGINLPTNEDRSFIRQMPARVAKSDRHMYLFSDFLVLGKTKKKDGPHGMPVIKMIDSWKVSDLRVQCSSPTIATLHNGDSQGAPSVEFTTPVDLIAIEQACKESPSPKPSDEPVEEAA